MISPTVGRVVWFYRFDPATGHGPRPLAAHVAYVHSDSFVNLMVIDEKGVPFSQTSVRLIQDNEEAPAASYCCWMPYQKGQAAKAEALQKQIDDKACNCGADRTGPSAEAHAETCPAR